MTYEGFTENLFLLGGEPRPEYLYGIGIQRRLWRTGSLVLSIEADLMHHEIRDHPAFQNKVRKRNNSFLQDQTFNEIVLGLPLSYYPYKFLGLSIIPGLSVTTDLSGYERNFREDNKSGQFLGYMGLEIEAMLSKNWAVAFRIHHRSGLFGTFSNTYDGSNGYIGGLRYRF